MEEAKYTITINTTDLIANEELFGKEHGAFTGFVILGFKDGGVQQIMHDVNLTEIAAAIDGSPQLSKAAMLAMLAKGSD